jgi:cation transport ATPase
MANKTTQLAIEGMHCASCSTILSGAAERPGRRGANVNYSTQKGMVVAQENVPDEQLIQAVVGKGLRCARHRRH